MGIDLWFRVNISESIRINYEFIKLGLVESFGFYCNFRSHKCQKYKTKLVAGFQISLLIIDLDQVNHLKNLRGGIQKFWKFLHLP